MCAPRCLLFAVVVVTLPNESFWNISLRKLKPCTWQWIVVGVFIIMSPKRKTHDKLFYHKNHKTQTFNTQTCPCTSWKNPHKNVAMTKKRSLSGKNINFWGTFQFMTIFPSAGSLRVYPIDILLIHNILAEIIKISTSVFPYTSHLPYVR